MPDFQTLMRPVLQAFAEGERTVQDVLPDLVRQFHLTAEDTSALIPSKRMTVLASRAHWARTHLGKAGLLRSPRRGRHDITEHGRAVLREHPLMINMSVLNQIEAYRMWRTSSGAANSDLGIIPSDETSSVERRATRPTTSEAVLVAAASPDEIIAQAHSELIAVLADDLLDRMRQMNPLRFEDLVIDLLLAMGYGSRREVMRRQLDRARSADGGIDGVIDEDALGLDAVYVQAKRYQEGSNIGRPTIQQFVGSLQGEGATKGVFVTTSAFSAEARDYAARVPQRVVLIDGPRLAHLMIDHDVGVRTRETYAVKTVDEDYFADPDA